MSADDSPDNARGTPAGEADSEMRHERRVRKARMPMKVLCESKRIN
jgi:hypothetical protein